MSIDNTISDILNSRRTVFSSKTLEEAAVSNTPENKIMYPLSEHLTFRISYTGDEEELRDASGEGSLHQVELRSSFNDEGIECDGLSIARKIVELVDKYIKINKTGPNIVVISCFDSLFKDGITIMIPKEEPKASWYNMGSMEIPLEDGESYIKIDLYELPMVPLTAESMVLALCEDPDNFLVKLK